LAISAIGNVPSGDNNSGDLEGDGVDRGRSWAREPCRSPRSALALTTSLMGWGTDVDTWSVDMRKGSTATKSPASHALPP